MPDLIHLLSFESHKLMMATPPHVKHWLKERVIEAMADPALDKQAALAKAMKQIQRELEIRLKSHPDAKAATIGLLVLFCVLLRHEVHEMAHSGHQLHTRQQIDSFLGHMSHVHQYAALLQPLLKGSYSLGSLETEALMRALRQTH